MRRLSFFLCILLCGPEAAAWNAAGHRLTALIAWQELSPQSRQFISAALAAHPDHGRWLERAGSRDDALVFAEAATWADGIRNDPRYYDEGRDKATPRLAGRYESRRHRSWHYVDLDAAGRPVKGQLDRQIERLGRLIGTSGDPAEITYALPWLAHLVGDLHQPLHVGQAADEGGTRHGVENPLKRGQPVITLHAYWDELPGPSSLRGKRLRREAARLMAEHRPPAQGDADLWREESRHWHINAYPRQAGGRWPVIDEKFDRQARAIADRRLSEAGYRLGRLLETRLRQRVSRGTQSRRRPPETA